MGGWLPFTRIASSSTVRSSGPSRACELVCSLHVRRCTSSPVDCSIWFRGTVCALSRRFSYANCFQEWWEGEFILEDRRRKDCGGDGKSRV